MLATAKLLGRWTAAIMKLSIRGRAGTHSAHLEQDAKCQPLVDMCMVR